MSQATDAGKLTDEVKNLFAKAVQGNIDLANRLSRLGAGAARELSARVQQKSLPSPGESLTRLAEINLAYWSAVAEHSLGFANDLAGAAERAFAVQGCRAEPRPAPSPMAIQVTAHPGERVIAGFQVENTFSDPLDISFQAGDLISTEGKAFKGKAVEFTPKQLTLAPRTQAVIQAAIDVPGECKAGESYTVGVKPVGFPMKEFSIRLNLVAAEPKAAESSRTPEAKKKTKKGGA